MQRVKTVVAWATALLVAGCATSGGAPQGPVHHVALPLQWSHSTDAQGDGISQRWWDSFGSAELDGWVALAHAQSGDVAAAVARVQQARAHARGAGAGLFPEINGHLDAGREGRLDSGPGAAGNHFRAGLSASYELDFWGRQAATRDAAQAAVQASLFERDTVRLTVTAAVAAAWMQAVGLRERTDLAQRNLATAERLLQLVASRHRAGAASALELAQQRALVAAQQRSLALLRMQEADARTALAVLTGQALPVQAQVARLADLQVPQIHAGTPLELVTRRPDIARAEARLAAAHADLQAARAAMLPRWTLGAQVGAQSNALRSVLDNPLYSLAAGLAAPIFDAGRLAAGRDRAEAQREELLAGYRQAIVQAVGDVQMALHAVEGADSQAAAQAQELAQSGKALALAEARYRAGAQTLMELLDTQRSLFHAQDQAVQVQQERVLARVALYKALGGGWAPDDTTAQP